jgi:hypothetical protein
MPWLAVDDPEDGERPPSKCERKLLERSIALGHFAAMADGLGATETSIALQQAKKARPGNLHLPRQELVQVERTDAPARTVLGAAVASSGIIPLPREGSLEAFRSALETVYGDKVMFLTIDAEILKQIDAGIMPIADKQPSQPIAEPPPFWSEERQYSDQTELTPIKLITLVRPPPLTKLS